jgi:hypothetical protein
LLINDWPVRRYLPIVHCRWGPNLDGPRSDLERLLIFGEKSVNGMVYAVGLHEPKSGYPYRPPHAQGLCPRVLTGSLARLTGSLARLTGSLARLTGSLARLTGSLARLTGSLPQGDPMPPTSQGVVLSRRF